MVSEYTAIEQAKEASAEWLICMDGHEHAHSWSSAASIFKQAITQDAWVRAIESVREQFGMCQNRTYISSIFTQELPDAPTGYYVVIQYDAQFELRSNVIESVTCFKEADGMWKVAGYYLK